MHAVERHPAPWQLLAISRRVPRALVIAAASAVLALIAADMLVTGLPGANGVMVATPVWTLLMLVSAVSLGTVLIPAMPELEQISTNAPHRIAVGILGISTGCTVVLLALAGLASPEAPTWAMARSLVWWVALDLIGWRLAANQSWLVPLAVALTMLWFGFSVGGPKAWAVPFHTDTGAGSWVATACLSVLAVLAALTSDGRLRRPTWRR